MTGLCPRCTDVLRVWTHGDAEMLACPRCGGGLLTPGALATSLGEQARPQTWEDRGLAQRRGPSPLSCPAHGDARPPMHLFDIQYEGASVEVDVCTECASIWLDAGEGRELQQITDAVHAAERQSLPEWHDEEAHARAFAAAVKSDDLLSGQVSVGATRRRPWVTYAIAIVCVSLLALLSDRDMLRLLAYRPDELWAGQRLYGLATHMFAHYGLGHLFGNMLFLLIVGPSLERHLGKRLFTMLFLSAGLGSFLLHASVYGDGSVPVLGASGAVAGLIGALLVEAPRQRALLRSSKTPTRFQTALLVGVWLIVDVVIPALSEPDVAWLGHLGGFVVGMAFAGALRVLELPRAVVPRATAPSSRGAIARTLDRVADWTSERPMIAIPIYGVLFLVAVVIAVDYSTRRECDTMRFGAAEAFRAYAERVEEHPPVSGNVIFEPPTPTEARARASALEAGTVEPGFFVVPPTGDLVADELLRRAAQLASGAFFSCAP